MNRTTYKVPKFYLDGKPASKTAAIFLKYSFAPRQRIVYFTGERVDRSHWNPETQRVKKQVTGSLQVNSLLDRLFETAQKTARETRLRGETVSMETLRTELDKAAGRTSTKEGFFDYFDEFILNESRLKSWTPGTIKKVSTVRGQLLAFETKQRALGKDVRLSIRQQDEAFFRDLIAFWQTEYGLRNSTIEVNIKWLRWFFNWCVGRGYTTDKFKAVKVNLKETTNKIVYLDMIELRRITSTDIPDSKEYLHRIRDVFIFQCLTGLRFSDLFSLKTTDIHDGVLLVNTIKTGEVVEIMLNRTTQSILSKYKQHQQSTGNALPVPHNQVYNRFLKELAHLAGIDDKVTRVHYKGNERIEETFEKWQLITTHTARRSFISNSFALNTPQEVTRAATGHQSEKSFKVYQAIDTERKRTEAAKMNL